MSDIVSRIKVQVDGADQSVKEIEKLEGAYKKTSDAAKGVSPTGGASTDPFERALSPTLPPMGGSLQNRTEHAAANERAERRQRQTESMAGGGINSAVGAASGAMMQLGSGNGAQGAGSALGGVAKMIGMGTGIGAGIAVGSTILNAIGALSGKEKERVQQLQGTGLSPRLGATYGGLRGATIAMGQGGISSSRVTSLFQALAGAGGQLNNQDTWRKITEMGSIMEFYGLPPETIGSLMGQQQQLGTTGASNKQIIATASKDFGRGAMPEFLAEMTRIQGENLALGQTKYTQGGDMLEDATLLGNIKTQGGLSASGSVAAMQQIYSAGRGATALSSPEQVQAYQLMRQRYPNMSMTDLMMYMEANPAEVSRVMAEHIEKTSPNKDVARLRGQMFFGGNMSQTVGAMGGLSAPTEGMGIAEANAIIDKDSEIAAAGMEKMATDQSKLYQGFERVAYDISQAITKGVRGRLDELGAIDFGLTLKEGTALNQSRSEYDLQAKIDAVGATNQLNKLIDTASSDPEYKAKLVDIVTRTVRSFPEGASTAAMNYPPGTGSGALPMAMDQSLAKTLTGEAYGDWLAEYQRLGSTLGYDEKSFNDIRKGSGEAVDTPVEKNEIVYVLSLMLQALDIIKENSDGAIFMDDRIGSQ